jgi:hypothetical protein
VVEGGYPLIDVVAQTCDYETGGLTGGSITVGEGEHVKSLNVYLQTDGGLVKQPILTDRSPGSYLGIVVFDDGVMATNTDGWKVSPSDPSKASKVIVIEAAECNIEKPVVTISESVCTAEGVASEVTVTVEASPGVTSEYRINNSATWTPYTVPFTAQAGDEIDVRHYAPSQYLFPNGRNMAWDYDRVVNTPDCPVVVTITGGPSVTDPTCMANGTLVVSPAKGVVFAGGSNGDGPGNYVLTASAESVDYTLAGDIGPWPLTVKSKLTTGCPGGLAFTGTEIGGTVIGGLALLLTGLVIAQRRRILGFVRRITGSSLAA